jgi:hypothetical protein
MKKGGQGVPLLEEERGMAATECRPRCGFGLLYFDDERPPESRRMSGNGIDGTQSRSSAVSGVIGEASACSLTGDGWGLYSASVKYTMVYQSVFDER